MNFRSHFTNQVNKTSEKEAEAETGQGDFIPTTSCLEELEVKLAVEYKTRMSSIHFETRKTRTTYKNRS